MKCTDSIYLELCQDIIDNGVHKSDRTGTGTKSLFGRQMVFKNIEDNFPVLLTKKLSLHSIIHELLWFLNGDTNITYLQVNGVSIWNEWADEKGDLGPIYGHQWRSWEGIDQIQKLIHNIKTNPDSRRHIVSAWNVSDLDKMALPPCHCLFQFYVADGKLSCQLYQRSADIFLGVPFNFVSYSLLTKMIAQVCNLKAGDFIHTFGDVHLYDNHIEQMEKQIKRLDDIKNLEKPTVWMDSSIKNIDAFRYGDIIFENYHPLPKIPAPVAV